MMQAPSEGAVQAKEAWDELKGLGPKQGKEEKKRVLLNAWSVSQTEQLQSTIYIINKTLVATRIKDRSFGQSFFTTIQTITSNNKRGVELRWKTRKQMVDIFGDQAEEMMGCCPARSHPANPKVTPPQNPRHKPNHFQHTRAHH